VPLPPAPHKPASVPAPPRRPPPLVPRPSPSRRCRASRGACPWCGCGRRWTSASPPASRSGKGARVVVMRDGGGAADELVPRLQQAGAEVLSVRGAPSSEELLAQLEAFSEAGPVRGVYWLPALDVEPSGLSAEAWREHLRVRVKLLSDAMRALYAAVSGQGTFLVAATRLGGSHGYDAAGAVAPPGRRGHRLREGVQARAAGRPREGRRLRRRGLPRPRRGAPRGRDPGRSGRGRGGLSGKAARPPRATSRSLPGA
jgi:hypothetical protein